MNFGRTENNATVVEPADLFVALGIFSQLCESAHELLSFCGGLITIPSGELPGEGRYSSASLGEPFC